MVIEVLREVEALEVVGIVDPLGGGESRKGVPIVEGATGIDFDRAISCEHKGRAELMDKCDINHEQLWLV
jgi:hypothetical protein